ncbi:hypothetical protein J6590_068173 [Homalodisca vitripennis]|nr:hypothetical protein J6590_090488 [Homalodisca vitripennis]KAG8261633.1 hypothetical protein J6590_068173 [Homalodisca vitripennis]
MYPNITTLRLDRRGHREVNDALLRPVQFVCDMHDCLCTRKWSTRFGRKCRSDYIAAMTLSRVTTCYITM